MSTTDTPHDTVRADKSEPEPSDSQTPLENCIPSYEKGYEDGVRDAMETLEEAIDAEPSETKNYPQAEEATDSLEIDMNGDTRINRGEDD